MVVVVIMVAILRHSTEASKERRGVRSSIIAGPPSYFIAAQITVCPAVRSRRSSPPTTRDRGRPSKLEILRCLYDVLPCSNRMPEE